MDNILVDERDQDFILYEMIDIENELCSTELYADYTPDVISMTLDVARKLAVEEVYPTITEGDREGCRWEDGNVYVPQCYHRLNDFFREGGWATISTSVEAGGQGFPQMINIAVVEGFISNFAFLSYPYLSAGAAHLIEKFGTEEQKRKYMDKMYANEWGGSMALTEPDAGSDVGNLKTKAVKQPDGSYRITGSKIFITAAESDLYDNIVNPVLARIEGDPAGTKGISIFLVPKYLVNDDGSLGERNDYTCTGIEHKMGLKGSATCSLSFGDNGNCYAELLGEERQGMKIMFQLMNEARISVGIQGLGSASAAYLHALSYAKERLQGASITNLQNPDAPRVPIIEHPDVRRMLMWMKAHVEGLRALVFYTGYCFDKTHALTDETEREKWQNRLDILTPICKSYCSDMGFRVTETAIQVYGGYGYCQDYPVEQFLRDEKIASIYEGTNGIQALDLVGRKLSQKKGANFINLLGAMNETIAECKKVEGISDLVEPVNEAVKLLGEMGLFFGGCAKEGKFMVPLSNAMPFLNMMGVITLGWLLLWQASIADGKISSILKDKGVDKGDAEKLNALLEDNNDAAYYDGKVRTARYYIKNILPEAEAIARGIKSEDLSYIDMNVESF